MKRNDDFCRFLSVFVRLFVSVEKKWRKMIQHNALSCTFAKKK